MMNIRVKRLLATLISLWFLTSCSALSSGLNMVLGGLTGSTGSVPGTSSGEPSGSSATQEGSGTTVGTDSTEDSSSTGDTGVGIQASIPLPNVIISDSDSSGSAHLMGSSLDSGYSLMVTNTSAGDRSSREIQKTFWMAFQESATLPFDLAYDTYRIHAGTFGRHAFVEKYLKTPELPRVTFKNGRSLERAELPWWRSVAQNIASAIVGNEVLASSGTVCGVANSQICTIAVDGSISNCELPSAQGGDHYEVTYVQYDSSADTCTAVSEVATETSLKSVQFVAGDVASANAVAWNSTSGQAETLANTSLVGISLDGSDWISSDPVAVALASDATAVDVNSSGYVSYLDAESIESDSGASSDTVCNASTHGCTPNRMKSKGEKQYYSTRYSNGDVNFAGFIYDLYDDGHNIEFMSPDSSVGLVDTLAFDVDDNLAALVIFQTTDDKIKWATKSNSALWSDRDPYSDTVPSIDISYVIDTSIYESQPTDDSSDGKAVLLTPTTIYQLDYDAMPVATSTSTTTTTTDPCEGVDAEEAAEMNCTPVTSSSSSTSSSGDAQSISIASSLTLTHTASAMALSEDKTKVFVLNDDDTVTIVNPEDLSYASDSDLRVCLNRCEDDTTTHSISSGNFSITDALGYTLLDNYHFTSINYVHDSVANENYLLIGANGVDSVLVLEVE